eukprot:COSAG02_NODE_14931_length_1222_cov_1.191451_1_plen_308_part_10
MCLARDGLATRGAAGRPRDYTVYSNIHATPGLIAGCTSERDLQVASGMVEKGKVWQRASVAAALHRAPVLIFLVVLAEWCIGQPQDSNLNTAGTPRTCKPRLTVVKEIRTAGSAGWEFWENGGEHFLATANFWVCASAPLSCAQHAIVLHDTISTVSLQHMYPLAFELTARGQDGRDRQMGAESEVFSIASTSAVLGGLATKSIQKIKGKGAHGVDVFTAYGHKLLVVPSYYGCGQQPQAGPRESWKCRSTAVLEWRDMLGSFVEIATLGTHGPAQTDHYTDREGHHHLVVGENFANEITVFRIEEHN